jgi:hypothetical protein
MSFSERNGHKAPRSEAPVRDSVPPEVRDRFLQLARAYNQPFLYDIVRKALGVRRDYSLKTDDDYYNAVAGIVRGADWFEFYDIAEALTQEFGNDSGPFALFDLRRELNELFEDHNLAWHIVGEEIVLRTGEATDAIIEGAISELETAHRPTAANELRKAVAALSRRPEPDTRDAVRFALGAMEAVARDITGDRKATLGEILKKRGGILPSTLDSAFSKAWGYSSDVARHVDENKAPTLDEAVLVVGLVGAGVAYLARPVP